MAPRATTWLTGTFLNLPKMPLCVGGIFSASASSFANGILEMGKRELTLVCPTCRPPSRGFTDTMCSNVFGREMTFPSRFFFFPFFPRLSSTCFSFKSTEISCCTTSNSRCCRSFYKQTVNSSRLPNINTTKFFRFHTCEEKK